MGITTDDDIDTLKRKLGPPSNSEASQYEWRCPPFLIKASKNGAASNERQLADAIAISNLAPVLEKEAEYERQRKLATISGDTLTPKQIFDLYSDRVVEIEAIDSAGEVYLTATGFAWRNSEILTNRHVIAQARSVRVNRRGSYDYLVVARTNKEQDWAVLRSYQSPLPSVTIAGSLPEVGDEVVVIGNPQGFKNSLSTGIVGSVRRDKECVWIQITAPISEGSSGSPVFDCKGQLLGLATKGAEGQNLNFATWAKQIADSLKEEPDAVEIAMNCLPLDHVSNDLSFPKLEELSTAAEIRELAEILLSRYSDPEDQKRVVDKVASVLSQ
jgi:S1-C subfamily serine protease